MGRQRKRFTVAEMNPAGKKGPGTAENSEGISLETLWKRSGFTPNENQRKAILHANGPVFLPAGPGSGKTRVLLWRVINLIAFHHVAPEEIYLSTFTEKAALQLRDGLRAMLGEVTAATNQPYDVSKMYVGTVHSLCHRMIVDRRFFPGRQRAQPPILKDELGQYMFLLRRPNWEAIRKAGGLDTAEINELFDAGGESRHTAVSSLISFFNRLSEEVIDPDQAIKRTRSANLKILLRMYRAYRELLRNEGGIEFTDLSLIQQQAVRVVEAHAGGVFKHVIVDEYQDTNTVQERLFFQLAKGHGNICVVGDDDQALYRFRGATVENFVEFPERCHKYLGRDARTIVLGRNYRSSPPIVDFYGEFIRHPYCDWRKAGGRGSYRVEAKKITAERPDSGPAVVASTPALPEDVAAETARLVRNLLDTGRVQDPNQIAFLFPSLKSTQVDRMRDALEAQKLEVYAPRAGSFLEVPESMAVLGLLFCIFDAPGHIHTEFQDWIGRATRYALDNLVYKDSKIQAFIDLKKGEVNQATNDFSALEQAVTLAGWKLDQAYDPAAMRASLQAAEGISDKAARALKSPYFDRMAQERLRSGRPFKLNYAVNRASSLDWNVLDLFYQFCGFKHFKKMFDAAEKGTDEGPVCNLSLVSGYLSKYIDENSALLTGKFLADKHFLIHFTNYLYILFRRGESEYENSEDPFPKGRIPFITVHQAKGLEFPVVVLANPRKNDKKPQWIEEMIQPLLQRKGEPLDRMARFDVMRMFYVALSRAKNLLVIAHYKGAGQHLHEPFADLLEKACRIPDFRANKLPVATVESRELPRTFSYTGDYLYYRKCPRQYMLFREYGFAPSRAQTMFFGSLVHQTLEDLHQHLIGERERT